MASLRTVVPRSSRLCVTVRDGDSLSTKTTVLQNANHFGSRVYGVGGTGDFVSYRRHEIRHEITSVVLDGFARLQVSLVAVTGNDAALRDAVGARQYDVV